MRACCLAVCLAGIAAAQTPALVRGTLLECDADEFSVRAADSQVFRFKFDKRTYVERESQLIDATRLQPGENVEVISDVVSGTPLRYARTVHVLPDPTAPRPLSAGRLRAPRASSSTLPDRYLPTGNLTYSGVVFRMNGERLVLHTRDGGEQSILLRKDTRYVANGAMVEAADLKPNMRVFIRAGKDLYDEIEAYQVIWGSILDPK
jgi:hypothetical protein